MHEDHPAVLATLERRQRLHRISAPVSKDGELACICRWAFDATASGRQRALLFEHVIGHDHPVSVGLYGSVELYALALGLAPCDLYPRWAEAITSPIPTRSVPEGPVQEMVQTGDSVNLETIPVPIWTPGQDTHPYISSAGVITKDPDSGVQNMGVYRAQVQDRGHLGLFFGSKKQHGALHLAKYRRRGNPMPVALVIGGPPAVNFAAAAKTTYGVDELGTAGGLAGAPIPVVPGVTVDLQVPACAEYVIEGTVDPHTLHAEGPFGEALGYMDQATTAPQVQVTALTHRATPIFHGYMQQLPPSEGHLVWEIAALGAIWTYFRHQMHLEWLLDIAVIPGSGGLSGIALQVRHGTEGAVDRLVQIFTQMTFGQKQIVIVDDDIDVRDNLALQWALSTRTDPARDVHLVDGLETYLRDPAVLHRQHSDGQNELHAPFTSSLMVIDATLKSASPPVALPTSEQMQAVATRWDSYGLPALQDNARLRKLLRLQEDH